MTQVPGVPQYIGAEAVIKILQWSLVNDAVEQAMKAVSFKNVHPNATADPVAFQPARSITAAGNKGVLLSMPSYVGNYELSGSEISSKRNTLACKLVTSFQGNKNLSSPLPSILANILLFNTETGQLQAILDGTEITAWRTAAASIVATKYLYFHRFPEREQRIVRVAIIGCGVQGQSHALGMCSTFNVSKITLWNRTTSKAEALAALLRSKCSNKAEVRVASSPQEAVADADIICVATYSPSSLIDYQMLKREGAIHINTVGAGEVHFGEVDQSIYNKSKVYVDSWVNAEKELKDLKADIVAEVGEVINSGKFPNEEGITIFQSMGMASEDATVAEAVYQQFLLTAK